MGGKSSRDKGARYERKIASYLRDALRRPFERRLEQWRRGGDDFVHDFEEWISLEAKDVAASSLGAWIDQSVESAGSRLAFVIHHRRGNSDPSRDFATTTVADLVEILDLLGAYVAEYGPPSPIIRPTTKETTK